MTPLYEYRCPTGHVSEELAPMNKRPKATRCHECGKKADLVMAKHVPEPSGRHSYSPGTGRSGREQARS